MTTNKKKLFAFFTFTLLCCNKKNYKEPKSEKSQKSIDSYICNDKDPVKNKITNSTISINKKNEKQNIKQDSKIVSEEPKPLNLINKNKESFEKIEEKKPEKPKNLTEEKKTEDLKSNKLDPEVVDEKKEKPNDKKNELSDDEINKKKELKEKELKENEEKEKELKEKELKENEEKLLYEKNIKTLESLILKKDSKDGFEEIIKIILTEIRKTFKILSDNPYNGSLKYEISSLIVDSIEKIEAYLTEEEKKNTTLGSITENSKESLINILMWMVNSQMLTKYSSIWPDLNDRISFLKKNKNNYIQFNSPDTIMVFNEAIDTYNIGIQKF